MSYLTRFDRGQISTIMRDQDQVAAAIDKVFALEEKQSQVSPSEGQSD